MIDLAPQYLSIVKEILTRHVPEYEVWVFGSRVGGRVKPHSDLDLAIITSSPLELVRLGELRDAFAESDLPIRVDVVDWFSATDEFKDVIRKKYEVLPPD